MGRKKKRRTPRCFPCGPESCDKMTPAALHQVRNLLQIVMAQGADNKRITEAVHAIAALLPPHSLTAILKSESPGK